MAIFVPRFVRQLRDVLLTAPADGEVLTYDSADAKWKNEAGGGGGGLTYAQILAALAADGWTFDILTGIVTLNPDDPADPALIIEGIPGQVLRPGLIVDLDPTHFNGAALLCDGVAGGSVDLTDTVAWGPGGSFNNLSWGSFGVDGDQSVTIQLGAVGSPYVCLWGPLGFSFKDTAFVDTFKVLIDGSIFLARAGGTLGFLGATPVLQQTAASLADLWTALKDYGLLDAGSSAPSVGGAPTTATYITQTPDAGLSAEQALSALATGLVKNTTATGVLSIGAQGTDYYAPGGTDVAVADGGTGASTAAGARTNLDVPSNAEAVLDTLFDANTVLAADSDNTPAALTMGASTILARLAAGNIKAATPAELRTLLDVPTTGEAILDAIIDAKGDIIVGTAADTPARVAIGADSLVATADSSQSAGISWQRPIGGVSALPAAALYETASRMMITQNFAALATTRLTMVAIVLPKGITITSITFLSGSTALSVGVNQFFGLYDDHLGTSTGTARALLRGSNDDGATAWGTNTLKTLNLTSSYLTTRSGTFYLGILVVATTVPNLLSTFAGATTLYQIEPKLAGTSNTAVTALPNPASALSTLASAPYAYVS